MGYQPIARTVPQYVDGNGDPYSGAVLKAYEAGTSTVISIAADTTGAALLTSITLNASGYPTVSGNVVIPALNQAYKLALYPDQSAADSNTGALWNIDNLSVGLSFGEKTVEVSSNTTLTQSEHANAHVNISGTSVLTFPPINAVANAMIFTYRNTGSESAVFDGDGADQINGAAVIEIKPGASGIVIAGDASWSVTGVFQDTTPIGIMQPYAGAVAPDNYLLCDGQELSRATYADLFAVIGVSYGVGDGLETFNIPDVRGRVLAGLDNMGGVPANRLTDQSNGIDGSTLGNVGGAETHVLTEAELATHGHVLKYTQGRSGRAAAVGPDDFWVPFTATSAQEIEDTGSDSPHNNVQPTMVVNYIIKAN